MNVHKKIEINQSSLLGLKAELLRKKKEVSTAKYSQSLNEPQLNKKKLTTKLDKSNEGVNERDKRDAEEIQEESEELKKSQKILEAKAKLYDKLSNNVGCTDSTIDTSGFLVDFKQKTNETADATEKQDQNSGSDYGEYSDDDEWVDFVDCLGRTKRCHKDDLEAMKDQDEKLRKSLLGDDKQKENEKEIHLPQLCSEDMKKEILRQKWEEQERNLLDKKNVHYQDILFDEARTHGVGYYGFSTDDAERARQQEELKNLRKETIEHQAEAQTVAQRKQKMMNERLRAARRRKRERLGLPLDEEIPDEIQITVDRKPEPPEELRRDVRKPAPTRPWDIGKDNSTRILTQEEWVEQKRTERIEEFAPPSLSSTKPFQKQNKRIRTHEVDSEFETIDKRTAEMVPIPIRDELEERGDTRGVGIEIPPPPTFDMYGPSCSSRRAFPNLRQSDIDKSIEEGLNFLRKQVEEKQSRRKRDEDIEII